MTNLLTNDADAMDGKGIVQITLRELAEAQPIEAPMVSGSVAGRCFRLTVADTGRGMSDSILNRVFEPFFTTKPVGRGTWLGLSMVNGIVMAWGGAIGIRSAPDRGTVFIIDVPILEEDQTQNGDDSSG